MTKDISKYRAPALDKGLDIIELLSGASKPLSIADISAGVERTRGEIFRMLLVLEDRGYIAHGDGDAGYSITPRLFRMGMEQPRVKSMMEAALPIMHRLANEIEQPCHLVVPSGEQIVVIARIDPPGDIGLIVRVGHRRPMSHSTSGKVLLAFQSDHVRDQWIEMIAKFEPDLNRIHLMRVLKQIRVHGYASSASLEVTGVTDLSAPILQHGYAVCALTVPFIRRNNSSKTIKITVTYLEKAVAEISEILNFG